MPVTRFRGENNLGDGDGEVDIEPDPDPHRAFMGVNVDDDIDDDLFGDSDDESEENQDSPDDSESTSEDTTDDRATDVEDYIAADLEASAEAGNAGAGWSSVATQTVGTYQCVCCGQRSPLEVPYRRATHNGLVCGYNVHSYCAEVTTVPILCMCREGVIDELAEAPRASDVGNVGDVGDVGEGSSSSSGHTTAGNQCVFCWGSMDGWTGFGQVTHHGVACGSGYHLDCLGTATAAVQCLCEGGLIDFARPRYTG